MTTPNQAGYDALRIPQGACDDDPAYEYGVVHITADSKGVRPHGRREGAERDAARCQRGGSPCCLVRRPVAWERVPDGE